jgi:kumamolisin
MYFAPNIDDGFLHGNNKDIHDQINQPFIVSRSWGLAENLWTDQTNECTREFS